MFSRIRRLLVLSVIASALGAVGQVRTDARTNLITISGRIVNSKGDPVPGLSLTLRNITTQKRMAIAGRPPEDSKVKTDPEGKFAFSAIRGNQDQIFPDLPNEEGGEVGTFQVVGGNGLSIGDVVLDSTPRGTVVRLAGPIQVVAPPSQRAMGDSGHVRAAGPIAAIYVVCPAVPGFCDAGTVHIVFADGKDVQPPAVKDQIGSEDARVSEDGAVAAWLADYANCCTSYPLALKLVIYTPTGRSQSFDGDGRGIFEWYFVAGGRQVTFYQDVAHGNPEPHYELRDVETNRLVGEWNGRITSKSPSWLRVFQPVPY